MATFRDLFGTDATVRAEAPGRVNLIGEHTDYNEGFVLPTAIPQRTAVECLRRNDRRVRVASDAAEPAEAVLEYDLGSETPGGSWLDYVQGTTHVLVEAGHDLRGFDALVHSTVPIGAGLSSSATLDVALLRALRAAFGFSFDDLALARLAQRTEVSFVGARVGIMDPMAATLCDPKHALFLDTRTLTYEHVAIPADLELAVIDSGTRHRHASGGYNTRRRECEDACRALGVAALRDVAPDDPRVDRLAEPLARRVRHVVTENERVIAAVEAMRRSDAPTLGRLFAASHASMRDDYEVSIPEIDLLVELAVAESDVFGARLTGGGFGGSIVILARRGHARGVAERIVAKYARRGAGRAAILVPAVETTAR